MLIKRKLTLRKESFLTQSNSPKTPTLIHEQDDPELGLVKYGELTLNDAFVIEKCRSDQDKTAMAAYLMLKKAYPAMKDYTPDNILEWQKTMPMAEGAMLLLFIRNTPAFLRTQSLPGFSKNSDAQKVARVLKCFPPIPP